MTATTVTPPRHATPAPAQRYDRRRPAALLSVLAAGSLITGAWTVLAALTALAVAGPLLLWTCDVLSGRRTTRHTWLAVVVACATGAALLAVMAQALERGIG